MQSMFVMLCLLAGDEFPAGVYPGQQNQPAFREVASTIEVTAYTTDGCVPCLNMKRDVGSGGNGIRVTWINGMPPAGVPQQFPVVTWNDSSGNLRYRNGYHTLDQLESSVRATIVHSSAKSTIVAEASPTPYAEVVRVINLLPKPEVGFVDYGCGDARWLIVAAEKWGCKCTGVEIDPARAAAARERVKAAGLSHLITIVTGDATDVDVTADVGVAYLYGDVLAKLAPKIEKLTAFASYLHRPAGVAVVQNGDTWIYTKPVASAQAQQRTAVWGGQVYAGRVCQDPSCRMCNSIQAQIWGR